MTKLDDMPYEGRFDGDYVYMSVPMRKYWWIGPPEWAFGPIIGFRRITVRCEGAKAVEVLPNPNG